MMKIMQVLCQTPGLTGSGVYLEALVRAGASAGISQCVVAGVPFADTDAATQRIRQATFFPVQFETDALPFPIVGMSDVMPYPSTRYRDLTKEMLESWKTAFRKTLVQAVEAFRPDIIISHHLWLLTALTRQTLPQIPVLGLCHSTCLRQYQLAPGLADLARAGCRQLDGVFALHEEQKEEIHHLLDYPKERIQVIGAGYRPDFFYPPDEARSIRPLKLVYAGKLCTAKGVPSLIRVFERLSEKYPGLELHLAGSVIGEESREIMALAKDQSGITFHGRLTQESLGELFRSSHLLVLPSFYEGLPLVVIEALTSGMRVVTTDLPGLKSYLDPVIGSMDLVHYVEMPRCVVDQPFAEDLPAFEDRLYDAISVQLDLARQGDHHPHGQAWEKAIRALSWDGVWDRMMTCAMPFVSHCKS
ncbi:MAG: glycosyltransferase [Syntrophaceticus sp.]|jgi:glycosyltransferase involved in cell wall biosynthesis|nr:glycosyltransferase [Syntrophaceticus sp.]MDD3314564.1 glycosyltransferase [Syntrophaceticus sp.]MDD4359553.1 glycosyltransferase [Syntrophaceticus sp.]MDD4782377.1 glycosyltransferase [Syntrophaceticus sp.]